MKNLDLNAYGVVAMPKQEQQEVNGGEWQYASLSFGNHGNPIVYAAEAVANGGKAIYNGLAWCVNSIFY